MRVEVLRRVLLAVLVGWLELCALLRSPLHLVLLVRVLALLRLLAPLLLFRSEQLRPRGAG